MGGDLHERIEAVRARMRAAAERAGRDPESVRLVAISKAHPPEAVREAAECGIRVFGESKVQEAKAKIPLCPGHLSWHMVGHLQRNKAGLAAELFDRVHSVDSLRLLETLDRAAAEAGKVLPVFIEVNVSGEGSKFGLPPEGVPELLRAAAGLSSLSV